jgi:hypothetical protein
MIFATHCGLCGQSLAFLMPAAACGIYNRADPFSIAADDAAVVQRTLA